MMGLLFSGMSDVQLNSKNVISFGELLRLVSYHSVIPTRSRSFSLVTLLKHTPTDSPSPSLVSHGSPQTHSQGFSIVDVSSVTHDNRAVATN